MIAASIEPRISGFKTRLPELDGLRALAIIPVIVNHYHPTQGFWGLVCTPADAGWMGVDLFFVLSGYFISGILLDTAHRIHYYRDFLIRRTLRIFPLYFLSLALFTAATMASRTQWEAMQSWGGVGWFFAYLGNIRAAWVGVGPPVFSFGPLWSLQVEEQFYLLYPFVVLSLSRAGLRRFLIGCVVAAPVLRTCIIFLFPANLVANYVLWPCRMDSLALGGLVALLVRSRNGRHVNTRILRNCLVGTGAATLAIYVIARLDGKVASWGHPLMASIGYSFAGVTAAITLTLILFEPFGSLACVLRWRPLAYTGQISYGLYLLHSPASWAARSLIHYVTGFEIDSHSILCVPVTFAAAFAAATVSWRLFESPILALKEQWTR